jgi:hypothetical protein
MQTFLPYADFSRSAKVLDYRRLGKQRVECKQILLALDKVSGGWVNHPAVKMWRGHRASLAYYGLTMCREWIARGYNDSLLPYFVDEYQQASNQCHNHAPDWMGNADFHLSHQSNLVRKLPEHYQPLWPDVPSDLPYVWPTQL